MINTNTFRQYPFSYPILKNRLSIETNAYNDLKKNWPNFPIFNHLGRTSFQK